MSKTSNGLGWAGLWCLPLASQCRILQVSLGPTNTLWPQKTPLAGRDFLRISVSRSLALCLFPGRCCPGLKCLEVSQQETCRAQRWGLLQDRASDLGQSLQNIQDCSHSRFGKAQLFSSLHVSVCVCRLQGHGEGRWRLYELCDCGREQRGEPARMCMYACRGMGNVSTLHIGLRAGSYGMGVGLGE